MNARLDSPAPPLEAAVAAWKRKGWPAPKALVVAGSGLAVDLGAPRIGPLPLQELLPFPVHGVIGHAHAFEIVEPLPGVPVIYQRGRIHGYQGYDGHQVVFMVRLARLLGASLLLMTNAAGGLDPEYQAGDLVAIKDHINLTGSNPLLGALPPDWGPQFPPMDDAYDPELRQLLAKKAEQLSVRLQEGVYISVLGPSYETPAEVRAFHRWGAQLVGMSTVQEVIAARHMGMRCLCMSLVSNLAAGVSPVPLHHEEVLEAGRQAANDIRRLLEAVLRDPRAYGTS
ncbi:MAG: purine-nucleoside phosphorylase [Acidobacteria bacterium]|nr:purine-nucleoside phosphorylase [Acidobacteriota bacterium]